MANTDTSINNTVLPLNVLDRIARIRQVCSFSLFRMIKFFFFCRTVFLEHITSPRLGKSFPTNLTTTLRAES